jgi:imidazolonepropionase-like amidohydrolase
MKHKSMLLIMTLGCVFTVSAGQTVRSRGVTAIRAARVIDVKNRAVISNAVVLAEGDHITAVGTDVRVPQGASVVDLGNSTLLPGLIDSHTHLLSNYDAGRNSGEIEMLLTIAQMSTAKRALLGAAMAREDLEAGITTVRDLGNSGLNGDVALRDAIEAGWVAGPRIVASTRAIAAAGGQLGTLSPEAQKLIEQEYAVISGVDEARRAVRQAFYDGADCIKVIVNTGQRVLSLDEMKVIVEEAHRVGRKVAAHAIGNLATRVAAEAGVDSIEHAYTVPDDVLAMMASKRIFLVPTDGSLEAFREMSFNGRHPTTEERSSLEQDVKPFVAGSSERLRRAIKAGVRIAAGSDMYIIWPGKTRGQASLAVLGTYADSGMEPWEIISAATLNAAELLGRNDIGAIEPGKLADLVAVTADPLKDARELQHVRFVMKGGQIVRNDITNK